MIEGGTTLARRLERYRATARSLDVPEGFAPSGPPGPELAERLYLRFAAALSSLGVTVATGTFGAEMAVELVNDGPFTIWLDTVDR